jgi:hypothetical protein
MTWVTRQRPTVDRIACPWLIARFVDQWAECLTPESRGLEALAGGFQRAFSDEHAQRAAELPVYDALYAYCQGLGEAEQQT